MTKPQNGDALAAYSNSAPVKAAEIAANASKAQNLNSMGKATKYLNKTLQSAKTAPQPVPGVESN